jgi:iron-only hydrogenase group A
MVKITINDMEVEAQPSQKILEVAQKNGFRIPTFCFHERLRAIGSCRMCVVEVEGAKNLQTACSTEIKEGMKIWTHTQRVIEARRVILELLLANHDLNCPTCRKNLNCVLQEYSQEFMIEKIRYEGAKRNYPKDESTVSLVRDPGKCILCERCIRVCKDVQTVYAIDHFNRGFFTGICSPFRHPLAESACINCGQCVVNCPTGALVEKSELGPVIESLRNKKGKLLVVQVAPSIRATLGECFGLPAGSFVTGKMVTALKRIGFDKVFDTDLCADMTIVEEATEFVKRFKNKSDLPLITTCCPAWIKFGEEFYFDELHHMSTCMSPQAMMARLIRTYFAQKAGINPQDIVLIDIMPCTAKKYEIQRPEFKGDVDHVLTTVELGRLLKEFGVDFESLPDSAFDNPLGQASGAGVIFGRTGGVMEAALRTAADFLTGKDLAEIEYTKCRGMDYLKEAIIELAGKKIKIAVVHSIGAARKIMEQIKAKNCPYDFIEIMACYGGCVGGGGQPPLSSEKILQLRARALNCNDAALPFRKSHKNPTVQQIYKEFIGEFGSEQAHKLLHTKYYKKNYIG